MIIMYSSVASSFEPAKNVDVFDVKRINGDEGGEEGDPKFWRAILGDICQLPGFPRATGDPTRYVECVRQSSETGDR